VQPVLQDRSEPLLGEYGELADFHLQVGPGTDAWLLAAMLGVLVQEDLLAREWLGLHADGLGEVLPHVADLPIAQYCEACGVPEEYRESRCTV
jgi:anaerobic selenocysteine-containing dehydrogenase